MDVGQFGAVDAASDDDLQAGRYTFDHIADAARRAVSTGRLADQPPVAIAAQVWSALHGYVVLELAGYYTPPDAGVRNVLKPMMRNLIVGLGDDQTKATASSAAWFSQVDSAERQESASSSVYFWSAFTYMDPRPRAAR